MCLDVPCCDLCYIFCFDIYSDIMVPQIAQKQRLCHPKVGTITLLFFTLVIDGKLDFSAAQTINSSRQVIWLGYLAGLPGQVIPGWVTWLGCLAGLPGWVTWLGYLARLPGWVTWLDYLAAKFKQSGFSCNSSGKGILCYLSFTMLMCL